MRSPNPPLAMTRRPGFADIVLGALGAFAIRVVLGAARLWARVTRSPWHG